MEKLTSASARRPPKRLEIRTAWSSVLMPLAPSRLFICHQAKFSWVSSVGNGFFIADSTLLIERFEGCIEGLHAMLGTRLDDVRQLMGFTLTDEVAYTGCSQHYFQGA